MIQFGRPSVTPVRTRLPRSGPQTKNKISHSLVLIRPPLTNSFVLIYTPRRKHGPSLSTPLSMAPRCPCPLPHRALIRCHVIPHCRTCRAPVLDTYAALSLAICPSVSHRRHARRWPYHCRTCAFAVASQVFPAQAKGTNERGRCSCAVARHRLRLRRPESTSLAFPSPMLHMYVSIVSDVSDVRCNYFILILQK